MEYQHSDHCADEQQAIDSIIKLQEPRRLASPASGEIRGKVSRGAVGGILSAAD